MQIQVLKYRIAAFVLSAAVLYACHPAGTEPYRGTLCPLTVLADYGEQYQSFVREGVTVKAENMLLGYTYSASTDAGGAAHFVLPPALYRVSVSDRSGRDLFNATADNFALTAGGTSLTLTMKHSTAGSLVIKEIYTGGCRKDPEEGTYQVDQYVIIHNNNFETEYLDSLCFGTLHPYNANAANPFLGKDAGGNNVYPDFVPIADAVWEFGGDGTAFPLQPGEDAVLCIRGAINHAARYPLSVNLDKPEYFVTYDANLFPNKTFNPAPGPNIREDHILRCVTKTNPSVNATTMSNSSPTAVLYRARGMSMEEFIALQGSVKPIPGASNGANVLACPKEWVLDAVEVFNGSSSANVKRLADDLDAGYVSLSTTFDSRALARRVDSVLSAESGYEVLTDSNNSSADFVELEKQSLRE